MTSDLTGKASTWQNPGWGPVESPPNDHIGHSDYSVLLRGFTTFMHTNALLGPSRLASKKGVNNGDVP